jgi:hypothetical protein
MGSPSTESKHRYDEKQHLVNISKQFYMGKYTITQEQYVALMSENPSHFKSTGKLPVENVSWDDTQKFCDKLNDKAKGAIPAGMKFQLPTETQWEYACRAGTTTRMYWGDDEADSNAFAWFKANSNNETHPVGEKKPNAWGLYDMSGNVNQWCQDFYATQPGAPKAAEGTLHALRGGSFADGGCRSAYRLAKPPEKKDHSVGFRVVLEMSPTTETKAPAVVAPITPNGGDGADVEMETNIVGAWKVETATFTFKKDKTMHFAAPGNADGGGSWKIEGKEIVIHWSWGPIDHYKFVDADTITNIVTGTAKKSKTGTRIK